MKVNYVSVVFSFIVYCVLYGNCNSNFRVTEEIGFKKEFYESKPNYDTKYSKGNQKKDYVDPLDMLNYVHSTKSMVQNDDKNKPGTNVVKGCESCSAYMQRFVNLFLISVGLKDYVIKRDKYVTLNLLIKKEDLDILHLFSEYGNTDLKVVNKALTDIFTSDVENEFMKKQNDHENHHEFFNNFFKPTLLVIGRLPLDYPQHCIAICVLFVFGTTLWLIITTRSFRLAVFSLLFIIFSAGFGWNWFKLYKIADAKRFSSRLINDNAIPIYCRPETMTWYQYVYYYYTYEKQCEEYFKREMVDPIIEVSPTVVLVETFATIILHPADKLGSAIGTFVSALIDAVPWPYKVFVVPGILLFVAIFVTIICVVLVGGRLTFRIPFSSFEIGSATPRFIQMPNQQREFIESVPPPSSPNESICDKRTKRKNKNMTPKAKKEVSDLLNRLRNQSMIEDGSGDCETSNSKQLSMCGNSKSINSDKSSEKSQVHVHLHLPKNSTDYSNIGKNDNLNLKTVKDNIIIKQDGITQTNSKMHDKTKDKSDKSSVNSEYEHIKNTDLNGVNNSEVK